MTLEKSCTYRGLTTTTGTPAAAKIPVIGISNPPVASNTTSVGDASLRQSRIYAHPALSLEAANRPYHARLGQQGGWDD